MSSAILATALWFVFQHTANPDLLAVPSVARDEERHWVLAKSPEYLAHYAAKYGPVELVTRFWSRLRFREWVIVLVESIRNGNLRMLQYVLQHSNSEDLTIDD